MKKSILLAVVLMVALVAVPASASVQNIKVSGSIDSTYLWRDNFDLGFAPQNASDRNQSVFLTQTTLQVDADLTDQVSATVALINERAWETDVGATSDDTDIDLNLAYVTLREMLYSPLTVIIGRQVFSYGNSLVMDATGANNVAPGDSGISGVAADLTKQTALDAIRLIFDYNPLTLELLYSKVNPNTLTGVDLEDDVDLYGGNATYELGDDMNTQVEAYFFARVDKSTQGGTTSGDKSETVYVPGLRASADVLDGLNVQGEVAWQRGTRVASSTTGIDAENRSATAAQFISNYQIPNDVLPDALEEYNPVLQYVYTYTSGDSNPDDRGYSSQASANKHTGWDPFFEAQGGGTIYNTLFDLTNSHIHVVGLTVNPMEDVTSKVTWTGIWLDKKIDSGSTFSLRQPDGSTAVSAVATTDKEVGHEIDFETIYDYTEDVQFGASFGWFLPGDAFAGSNDDMASQAIVHGNVNF
jgi:hypothetical protein